MVVLTWFLVASVGVVGAVALWRAGHCSHPRPLGLVPPVVDDDGTRHPARWFCGQCGRYFPADFAHQQRPVQRFSGYDESKAPEAARRAAALSDRQRELAVRRAGMSKRPAPTPPARSTRPEPVPIRGRLAG